MIIFSDPQLVTEKLLRLAFILMGAYLAKRILAKVLARSLDKINHGISKKVRKERIKTLGSVLSNLTSFVIWGAALLIILSELGINIAPLVAGVGILGLGVGFASQALVRDYISGFFILFENQFNIGDLVEVAGKKGTVEELSLRTTILRDGEGKIHIIPNSQISTVTRHSKESS